MMKVMFKTILTALLLVFVMLFSGCAQRGESEAEKMAKEMIPSPDSFQKNSYTLNDKKNVAKLDYTFKNSKGELERTTAYFALDEKHIYYVDTKIVPRDVVEDLEKNHPDEFKDAVYAYWELKKADTILNLNYKRAAADYDDIENSRDNFFSWQFLKQSARKANDDIKEYRDAYDKAPDYIKEKFKTPPKYFKITLNGTYNSWSADAERTDTYPE